MTENQFFPFYERYVRWMPGRATGPIVFSVSLGFIFLALRNLSNQTCSDLSWLLAVLISVAMLSLYLATSTLRTLAAEMDVRLRQAGGPDQSCTSHQNDLKSILSDKWFVATGAGFALLNCYLGYQFGPPCCIGPSCSLGDWGLVSILAGYALVGFVCGMAVLGIVAVCRFVSSASPDSKCIFDFTSPDGCGGTSFVGDALLVFGSITVIVGVLISVYITQTQWTGAGTLLTTSLKGLWIVFPYVMSLGVIIVPALAVNAELRNYKLETAMRLNKQLSEIRKRIDETPIDPVAAKELRDRHEDLKELRKQLYSMRTWPFGSYGVTKYLTVVTGSAAGQIMGSLKAIHELISRA